MNRIETRFKALAEQGEKAFIPFITAGDPTLKQSGEIILELDRVGAEIIEYGIPFSDPIADGVVIQESSQRALKHNISLHDVVRQIKELRAKTDVAILLFTYYNPVLAYGIEAFAADCVDAEVDGVLCVDLPPEEDELYKRTLDDNGIATVYLAAPTTQPDRMKFIAESSTGFIYYVSRTGVTGIRDDIEQSARDMVRQIKQYSDKPVAVGFGISRPEHAEEVAHFADGVVVGSAIVKLIGELGDSPDLIQRVGAYVERLVQATKSVTEKVGP